MGALRIPRIGWGEGGLAARTALVAAVVIATNVVGNYALSRGLHQAGAPASFSPLAYIRDFSRPWVAAGVVFMLAWVISRLTLLSWADLSYVLPVTSISYALSALVGEVYLNEHVSALAWVAIALISLGAALVAFTPPDTTDAPARVR